MKVERLMLLSFKSTQNSIKDRIQKNQLAGSRQKTSDQDSEDFVSKPRDSQVFTFPCQKVGPPWCHIQSRCRELEVPQANMTSTWKLRLFLQGRGGALHWNFHGFIDGWWLPWVKMEFPTMLWSTNSPLTTDLPPFSTSVDWFFFLRFCSLVIPSHNSPRPRHEHLWWHVVSGLTLEFLPVWVCRVLQYHSVRTLTVYSSCINSCNSAMFFIQVQIFSSGGEGPLDSWHIKSTAIHQQGPLVL